MIYNLNGYIGGYIGGGYLLYHGSSTKLPSFAHHIKNRTMRVAFALNHPSSSGILFSSNSAVKICLTKTIEIGCFVDVYLLQIPPRPAAHLINIPIPSAGYLQAIKTTS